METATRTAPNYQHGRDIPDEVFLDAIRTVQASRRSGYVTRWDLAMVLGGLGDEFAEWSRIAEADGYAAATASGVFVWDVPGVPEKVLLSKARKLLKRGLIDGCVCGCRGDFQVAPQ